MGGGWDEPRNRSPSGRGGIRGNQSRGEGELLITFQRSSPWVLFLILFPIIFTTKLMCTCCRGGAVPGRSKPDTIPGIDCIDIRNLIVAVTSHSRNLCVCTAWIHSPPPSLTEVTLTLTWIAATAGLVGCAAFITGSAAECYSIREPILLSERSGRRRRGETPSLWSSFGSFVLAVQIKCWSFIPPKRE